MWRRPTTKSVEMRVYQTVGADAGGTAASAARYGFISASTASKAPVMRGTPASIFCSHYAGFLRPGQRKKSRGQHAVSFAMSLAMTIAKGLAVDSIDRLDQAVINPNKGARLPFTDGKGSACVSKTPFSLTPKLRKKTPKPGYARKKCGR